MSWWKRHTSWSYDCFSRSTSVVRLGLRGGAACALAESDDASDSLSRMPPASAAKADELEDEDADSV